MIAQADVVAMEGVDQIKVSPHKPIAAIHAIEAALRDAAPGVELAPRRKAIPLKCVRRHGPRLKRNSIVAIVVVEPPAFVEQPALALQTTIQRRAREWREVIERGNVKRMFPCESDRSGEAFRRIAVVTEDKRAVNADAMPAQICERLLKSAAHGIERFVHVPQVCRVQTLEPDQHPLTTAAREQFEKFFVECGVDARLAYPTDA